MNDYDLFLFEAAEKLEREHLLRTASLKQPSAPPPSCPPHKSAKQLPPDVLKRIEANRAAAMARLKHAGAAALAAQRPAPAAAPSRIASDSASEAESCSSQSSIKSYFKPDGSKRCSAQHQGDEGGVRHRHRPLADANATSHPPPHSSSQDAACSHAAAPAACNFKPFAAHPSSQSQSRPLLCAACSAPCPRDGCSSCVLQYPLSPPLRDYQFDLVQRSITRNTLVVLPTGLGKTFIAGPLLHPSL